MEYSWVSMCFVMFFFFLFEESGVKIEGKSGESKASGHRSKHSETEQRRRSKINERYLVTTAA